MVSYMKLDEGRHRNPPGRDERKDEHLQHPHQQLSRKREVNLRLARQTNRSLHHFKIKALPRDLFSFQGRLCLSESSHGGREEEDEQNLKHFTGGANSFPHETVNAAQREQLLFSEEML